MDTVDRSPCAERATSAEQAPVIRAVQAFPAELAFTPVSIPLYMCWQYSVAAFANLSVMNLQS